MDDSAAALKHVSVLFKRKYGLMFNMFGIMGKLRGAKYVMFKVVLK